VLIELRERVRQRPVVPDNLWQNARLGDDHPNALVGRLVAAAVDTWRGFEEDRVHGVTRRRRRFVAHRTPRADGRVDEAAAVARPQPLRAPKHPVVGEPRASLTWQTGQHLSVASPWASTWVYLRVRAVSGFSTRCQVRVECESLGECLRVTSARLSVARWLNGAKLGRQDILRFGRSDPGSKANGREFETGFECRGLEFGHRR
jgi:hypothetical protein